MTPDPELLVRLLGIALLIAGTIEYAEIVRRRVDVRVALAHDEQIAQEGLRALVRVIATD